MTVLKFHGVRGLLKRGDTPQYVEAEPEAYTASPNTNFCSSVIIGCRSFLFRSSTAIREFEGFAQPSSCPQFLPLFRRHLQDVIKVVTRKPIAERIVPFLSQTNREALLHIVFVLAVAQTPFIPHSFTSG